MFYFQINNAKLVGEINSTFILYKKTISEKPNSTPKSIAEKQKLRVANGFVFYSEDKSIFFDSFETFGELTA